MLEIFVGGIALEGRLDDLDEQLKELRERIDALESAQPAPAEAKSNLPRALQKFANWLDRFEINDDCTPKEASDVHPQD